MGYVNRMVARSSARLLGLGRYCTQALLGFHFRGVNSNGILMQIGIRFAGPISSTAAHCFPVFQSSDSAFPTREGFLKLNFPLDD